MWKISGTVLVLLGSASSKVGFEAKDRQAVKDARWAVENQDFWAELITNKKIRHLESGIAYTYSRRENNAGQGLLDESSYMVLQYTTHLIDDTLVDSSPHNHDAILRPKDQIQGLNEAMMFMKTEGDIFQFYIPAEVPHRIFSTA